MIGEVARDFGLYTKITGGQRIDLFGARVEQLPAIWQRLVDAGFESGHAYGKALRTVKSCVGSTWCRYGVQDSVGLAIALELRYRGLRSPHKLKLGVSGCARECAEARGKDFGVIATENGWNLYVGGNGGFTPRHAAAARRGPRHRDAGPRPSTGSSCTTSAPPTGCSAPRLDRGASRAASTTSARWSSTTRLGICADLDAAMAAHVDAYERRVGARPSTTRRSCAGSCPSSTHPTRPTRRWRTSASAVRPDPPRPRSALAQGFSSLARPWRSAHDHRADTGRRGPAQRLGGGVPPRQTSPGSAVPRPWWTGRRSRSSAPTTTRSSRSSSTTPTAGPTCSRAGSSGSRGEIPTVASPMYKQVFDLRTGQCLDAVGRQPLDVDAYPVRVLEDVVFVGREPLPAHRAS